jgi:hypothetical protein
MIIAAKPAQARVPVLLDELSILRLHFNSCVEGVQPDGTPAHVSLRKIPEELGGAVGSRFVAAELNVMKRPAALMEADVLAPLPCVPSEATETRCVEGVQPVGAPAQVSRTNTSATPLVSLTTRFVAEETNTA